LADENGARKKLHRTEINTVRYIRGLTFYSERKQEKSRAQGLRWFKHVDCENDIDWIKHCIMTKTEKVRQREHPERRQQKMVFQRICKAVVCPQKMHRLRMSGGKRSRENWLITVHLANGC